MEEAIIRFVEKNEFMYNKTHANYKNHYLRNQKFAELGQQLNLPMEKVKNRWRTLRDTYYKSIRAIRIHQKFGITGAKKKWKYLDLMMFLRNEYPNVRKRTTTTKVINEKPQEDNNCFDENHEYNIKIEPFDECEFEATNNTCDQNIKSNNETNCNTLGSKIPKSEPLLESTASSQMKELVLMSNGAFIEQQEKSYMRLFFDSIAQQVEETCISPQDFGKMQIEILKVVNEILYKN